MNDPEPEPSSSGHPAAALLLPAGLLTAVTPAGFFVIAAACLLIAFVFSLFENALLHFSRAKLMELAKRADREASIDAVLLHEDDLLFASKLGRGLMQTLGVALLVVAVIEINPGGLQVFAWALGGTVGFLVFNVAAPHVLASRFADDILVRSLVSYSRSIAVLRPLAGLTQRALARVLRAGHPPDPGAEITDDILSAVEEGTREGTVDESEKRMIEGVIDLREVTADHIMTPRTEMICLPLDATVQEAIERSRDRGLSRLPVYRETIDEIVGVLYLKDLLPALGRGEHPSVESLLRRPFFIPESKNVRELLQEMRIKQIHLAIVLDEYGGTAGLVTIEDIIEEIVGEIADEHEDAAASEVVRINESVATVEGRTHVEDLNRALDIDVPESEEYDTIGGLLFNRLGRLPAAGEQYELNGVRFTVLEADERRVNRVKVTVERG